MGIYLVVQKYDLGGPVSQIRKLNSESRRVREVRVPEALFLQMSITEEFVLAFDPATKNSYLRDGFMGTLYGVNVMVMKNAPVPPNRYQLPMDQYIAVVCTNSLEPADSTIRIID